MNFEKTGERVQDAYMAWTLWYDYTQHTPSPGCVSVRPAARPIFSRSHSLLLASTCAGIWYEHLYLYGSCTLHRYGVANDDAANPRFLAVPPTLALHPPFPPARQAACASGQLSELDPN